MPQATLQVGELSADAPSSDLRMIVHPMRLLPAGDNAFLAELGDVTAAELHAATREARAIDGVLACIPGHSSIYVIFHPERGSRVEARLRSRIVRPGDVTEPRSERTLTVSFADAPDLAEFLARTGQTREAFLARVATLTLTVRYLGFRGGFGYLDGWPEEWSMPRRATSRPFVARGTLAIAGAMAGFYPIDSPGGWNLLGRTAEDLEHALTPGDVLRIRPTLEPLLPRAGRAAVRGELRVPDADVISAPLATLVTEPDWSRVAQGRPPGGPFDDVAAALAMGAVMECTALLECAMTGPRLRFRRDGVVAWCPPDLDVRVQRVRAGEEIAFARINGGLRAYLAIGRGEGVVARVVRDERRVIRAARGPHDAGLATIDCEVTPHLDRVGIRLRPLQPIDAAIPADLRSCGMQCGTVQLHPDGSLVAMGPDHPITGGYLQPLTVLTAERWKLAQLVPGDRVRFVVEPTDGSAEQEP